MLTKILLAASCTCTSVKHNPPFDINTRFRLHITVGKRQSRGISMAATDALRDMYLPEALTEENADRNSSNDVNLTKLNTCVVKYLVKALPT